MNCLIVLHAKVKPSACASMHVCVRHKGAAEAKSLVSGSPDALPVEALQGRLMALLALQRSRMLFR